MASLVEYKSVDKVIKEENSEAVLKESTSEKQKQILSKLGGRIDSRWNTAKASKVRIEDRFMQGLRARRREYSGSMLAALKQMFGAEYDPVYAPVIETKCSAAESWIREIFFQKGEKPWDLEPTPMPELPESIVKIVEANVKAALMMKSQQDMMNGGPGMDPNALQQEAVKAMPEAKEAVQKVINALSKKSAQQVATKIEDMFVEGEWNKALSECIYDIVTFGTMIMKGPIIRKENVRKTMFDPATGKWKTKVESRLKEYWERVNPFDIYPLPGTTTPQDGDFFEIIRMRRRDLSDMLGVPGWEQEAVRNCLKEFKDSGWRVQKTTDQERLDLEGKESSDYNEDDGIDCLEYHGSAPGSMLREWGMTRNECPDLEKEYDIVAWMIGPYIIKAVINPDPLGTRPYYTAGFRQIPDSFWHVSVPELAESAQKLANAVFRSIAVNVAVASGPQIEVDVERLEPGEEYRLWPYRVWKATNQQLKEGQAVNFFQPQMVAQPLMDVFEFCLRMADEDTGVPRYAHGDPKTTGAGETASGLAMLMSQSAKGIKMVVKNIDDGVVAESVEYAYNYLVQYEEGLEIVGDLHGVATGSYALMAREQQAIRRTEFLVQTANPFDMEVLGVKGRSELIRQTLKSLDIDPDTVLKAAEEYEQTAKQMPGGVPPKNDAAISEPPAPQATGMAPPPAPAQTDMAGVPVAGRDNQLFESAPGMTP